MFLMLDFYLYQLLEIWQFLWYLSHRVVILQHNPSFIQFLFYLKGCSKYMYIYMFYALGLDAALYSAASTYYQQKMASVSSSVVSSAAAAPSAVPPASVTSSSSLWQARRPYQYQQRQRPRLPSRAPQLHYCDVCKISCAGPQVIACSFSGWNVAFISRKSVRS